MAGISAIQRILDNQLTSKFARTLKHSDLPEGWADNPEIVALAEDAYREMGTESPFFKAWGGNSKVVDEAGEPLKVYHGSAAEFDVFRPSKTGNLGPAIYITPDREAAEEFAKTHDGANIYELFINSENPLTLSNSLEASEEFWGKLAGKTEADAIADLHKQGYDGAWAVGRGESRWGNTAPEIAVYSPYQLKSTSNRGTFNPADPNIYKGLIPAIGAGGMLALLDADEAEAAPAAKDFAKNYAKAVRAKQPGHMEAGSVNDSAFDSAKRKEKGIQNNKVLMSIHAGDERWKKDNILPEETGRMVEELLNSLETRAMPNFPTDKPELNRSKFMFQVQDPESGKDIVAPFLAGKKGDIVLKTTMYPDYDKQNWLNSYLGRPTSPISGLRKNLPVHSRRDFLLSSEESSKDTIPDSSSIRKAMIPLVAGGAVLTPDEAQGTAYQFPADRRGTELYEPGLESPSFDPIDILLAPIGVAGTGAKAAAMAAEPFVSYGMDKLIGGILSLFDEEE